MSAEIERALRAVADESVGPAAKFHRCRFFLAFVDEQNRGYTITSLDESEIATLFRDWLAEPENMAATNDVQ